MGSNPARGANIFNIMITKDLAATILGQMENNDNFVLFCFFSDTFKDLWSKKKERLEIRKQCRQYIKDKNLCDWRSKESKNLLNSCTDLAVCKDYASSPLTTKEQKRIFRINFLKWIIDGKD